MRKWGANKLVRLARKIHPENEEAMAYYADRMVDLIVTGKSNVKVSVVSEEEMRAAAAHDEGEKK